MLERREPGGREGASTPPSQGWWAASYPLLQQLLTLISSLLQIWGKRLTLAQSLPTALHSECFRVFRKGPCQGSLRRTWQLRNQADWRGWNEDIENSLISRGHSNVSLAALVWLPLPSAAALGFHHEHWELSLQACSWLQIMEAYGSDSWSQVISPLTQLYGLPQRTKQLGFGHCAVLHFGEGFWEPGLFSLFFFFF